MPSVLLGSLFGIPLPITLACACLSVFILGRFAIKFTSGDSTSDSQDGEADVAQRETAATVVDELNSIAELIRRDLVAHDRSFENFKDYVARLESVTEDDLDEARARFTEESRAVLQRTNDLAMKISDAFEEVHKKVVDLVTLAGVAGKPTGHVQDKASLNEALQRMFVMRSRYKTTFSLVAVKVDPRSVADKNPEKLKDLRQKLGDLISVTIRDTDLVARVDKKSFVVLLPFAQLSAAMLFAERLRKVVESELPCTIFAGVSMVDDTDDPPTIIRRSVAAIESAERSGSNVAYVHDGKSCLPASELDVETESASNETAVAMAANA